MAASKADLVTFASGDLTLEGLLDFPAGSGPFSAVVVCHPHPLHGGEMHNNVVTGVASALAAGGVGALRFNFRGVGRSQGEFGHGFGEAEDARAALAFLALQDGVRGDQIGLVGYSFGAGVALGLVTAQPGLAKGVALISCPTRRLEESEDSALTTPKLLISGDRDHIIDGQRFILLAEGLADPKEVHLIEGADHFWQDQEGKVGALVVDFFRRWLRQESG